MKPPIRICVKDTKRKDLMEILLRGAGPFTRLRGKTRRSNINVWKYSVGDAIWVISLFAQKKVKEEQ
jgi:hypothetical protein